MTHQIQIIELDPQGNELGEQESYNQSFLESNISEANSNHSRAPVQLHVTTNIVATSDPLEFPPWQPSPKLKKLYNHFNNTILYQYPCVPCYYCSRLMYPTD